MGLVHTAKSLPAPGPHTFQLSGSLGTLGTNRRDRGKCQLSQSITAQREAASLKLAVRQETLSLTVLNPRDLEVASDHVHAPCPAHAWVGARPARPGSCAVTQRLASLSRCEARVGRAGGPQPAGSEPGHHAASHLPPLPQGVASGQNQTRPCTSHAQRLWAAAGGADTRGQTRGADTWGWGRGEPAAGRRGPQPICAQCVHAPRPPAGLTDGTRGPARRH